MVTQNAINVQTAASNTVLQGQGVGTAPAFSTATYPATTTINQVLYSSSANVVAGLATANNGVYITGTTGIPSVLAAGTTGQVLIATTGSAPSWGSVPSGGTGSIVQEIRATSTTATSNATTLALTGVTPTTANTVSLISLSLTPTSSSNILKFQFCAPFNTSAAVSSDIGVGFFLFAGTTFIKAFPCFNVAVITTNFTHVASFTHYVAAGTTSATTYAVYYAPIGGTAYILQTNGSVAFYNGANTAMTFTVTEVTP